MDGNIRYYLGKPTILSGMSTSSKKDRAKRKVQRKNRQKSRKIRK